MMISDVTFWRQVSNTDRRSTVQSLRVLDENKLSLTSSMRKSFVSWTRDILSLQRLVTWSHFSCTQHTAYHSICLTCAANHGSQSILNKRINQSFFGSSYYNVRIVCLSVCMSVICHTPLSMLHDPGPRLQRSSPWALGTCIPTLPPDPPTRSLMGRALSCQVTKWTYSERMCTLP